MTFLVMQVGSRACALPVAHVIETMRPLSIERIAGAPPFVLGLSVVRGKPVPVIDVAALLGTPGLALGRFVTIRAGARTVALGVQSVIGVREVDTGGLAEAPPLLGEARVAVEAVGSLDAEVLLVLSAARLVPDEVWTALSACEPS